MISSASDISQHPLGDVGVDRVGGDEHVVVTGGRDFDPLLVRGSARLRAAPWVNMEKGFETPLRKPCEAISECSANAWLRVSCPRPLGERPRPPHSFIHSPSSGEESMKLKDRYRDPISEMVCQMNWRPMTSFTNSC